VRASQRSRGAELTAVGCVLLLITLFANWQEASAQYLGISASSSATGWNGILGVAVGILAILLLVLVVIEMTGFDLRVPRSARSAVAVVLAASIFGLALAKNIVDDHSTLWSYLGVALAAVVVIGSVWSLLAGRPERVPAEPDRTSSVTYG
jgi:uncharacterized membrane protein AbrB (regulator of aidB expression)